MEIWYLLLILTSNVRLKTFYIIIELDHCEMVTKPRCCTSALLLNIVVKTLPGNAHKFAVASYTESATVRCYGEDRVAAEDRK